MVRENLFIYGVEGFIGFCFLLYALGPLLRTAYTEVSQTDVFDQDVFINITLAAVVFSVGIASFAGIPVLRKSSAKGIKLFMIISVIQIGTIICCHIAKTPDIDSPNILFALVFSIFVLAILVYFYSKKRQHFH